MKQVTNPPNPYNLYSIELLGEPPEAEVTVYEETSKSILTENKSPDIPFRWSLNPYRGCFHACMYCYARPTHHYLDFGSGTDFETRLVARVNAPELLEQAFRKKSWKREPVFFSGVTDCYQPLEVTYQLTRRCLTVCASYRNPVSIVTKGALIRRDLDLLLQLKEEAAIQVHLSIAFSDDNTARKVEPSAPSPSIRFKTVKFLADNGIPVGIALAPVIPGLNDHMIPEICRRAAESGATTAFMTPVRLPGSVQELFPAFLKKEFPAKASKVLAQIRDIKEGNLNRTEFGARMRGSGPRWEAIHWLFQKECRKQGLNSVQERELDTLVPDEKCDKAEAGQLSLFPLAE